MDKNAFDSALGATFDDLDDLLQADERQSTTDLISLDLIEPGPWQPRKYFDPIKISSLADTIAEHMQLDPIVVWRSPERDIYLLVAGERRWRAHKVLFQERGLEMYSHIEARILPDSLSEDEIWQLAVISNDEREDLDPFDEAEHFQTLIDERNYTQEQVAQLFGKSQQSISEDLKIPKLPSAIREEYRALDNDVPRSFLTLTTRIPDEAEQVGFWNTVKLPGVTFREAQRSQQAISKRLKSKSKRKVKPSSVPVFRSGKGFAKALEAYVQTEAGLTAIKQKELVELLNRIELAADKLKDQS